MFKYQCLGNSLDDLGKKEAWKVNEAQHGSIYSSYVITFHTPRYRASTL